MRRDGSMSPVVRRLSLERGDSVAALLYKPLEARVVLVRQFRFPTWDRGPGWIVETLAGKLEAGETPEAAVRREALEELGFRIGELESIAGFYVSPGGSSERVLLYCAEIANADRVAAGGGAADENEDIEAVELALADIPQAIADGTVCDAKTLVALLWLLRKLGHGA
jgi:ADP-ribose pyrophosphatase